MKIYQKYIRLFSCEKPCQLRMLILLGVMVLLVVEIKFLRSRKDVISELRKDQALIGQIKEMEERIARNSLSLPRRIEKSKVKENIQYVLEGTSVHEGTPFALINGMVFKVGDEIDEFLIDDIAMGSAVLKNNKTNEIRNLYLYNE